MSEKTAQYAVDTMLITHVPDDELGLDMMGLLEAIDFEYEPWCRIVGLDPDSEITLEVYTVMMRDYCKTWTEMGQQEFGREMDERRGKWENILNARA